MRATTLILLTIAVLIATGCSQTPETGTPEAGQPETGENQSPTELADYESHHKLILQSPGAVISWDTRTSSSETILNLDIDALAAARTLLPISDMTMAVVELEDTSLLLYDLESGVARNLYIEDQGELAGPKQPDFDATSGRLLFTRIEDDYFHLYLVDDALSDTATQREVLAIDRAIISPVFGNDGNSIHFGLHDAESGLSAICRFDISAQSYTPTAELDSEIQWLRVSPLDGSILTLSFLNVQGLLGRYADGSWKAISEENPALGDSFAIAGNSPDLVAPLRNEGIESFLIINYQTGQSFSVAYSGSPTVERLLDVRESQ